MASIMSSQYPPPPFYGTELESPQSEYMLPYAVPPQQSSLDTPNIQNHMLPFDAAGPNMKPHALATNARQAQSQLHDAPSSEEKKRNKLGYHRTSLACGHCRRRKIRCIPSPSGSQGRCINCIRLKKECSFHPVDQQGQPEPRGKQASQSSSGSKVGSATSSPALAHANPVEPSDKPLFDTSGAQQVPTLGTSVRKSSLTNAFLPSVKEGSLKVSVSQPYSIGDDPSGDWYLGHGSQDSDYRVDDLNTASKAYIPESPMGSQFPSLAYAAPPSSAGWTSASSDMASRDDFAWDDFSPPVRSMSYGGEPLSSRQPMQTTLPIHHGRQFIRRPSTLADIYPSNIDISLSNLGSGAGVMPNVTAPLSAGAIPASFGAWNQHTQLPTHISPPRAAEGDREAWGYEAMGSFSSTHADEFAHLPDPNPALYYSRG